MMFQNDPPPTFYTKFIKHTVFFFEVVPKRLSVFLSPFYHNFIQIGDSGVGKSCLLDKFLDDSSTNNFISTIGVDIRTRETVINNKKVKVQVWDTGGQQRYRPILAGCYRGALGVIIVFDVTNAMSFKNIKQWMVEVDEFATDSNIPRILVR